MLLDPFHSIPEVDYHPNFIAPTLVEGLFKALVGMQVRASHTLHMADGKAYQLHTPKLTFLTEGLEEETVFAPRYWGRSEPWPAVLEACKDKIESMLNQEFQVGVMLFYPDGKTISPYHTDPNNYGNTDFIPSLSFGATRTFAVKHSTSGKESKIQFRSGDLILMKPGCQKLYQHAILEDPDIHDMRINITFRKFGH